MRYCRTHGCDGLANASGYCAICDAEIAAGRHTPAPAPRWTDEETARVELPAVALHPDPELTGMVLKSSTWNWETKELVQVWGFETE